MIALGWLAGWLSLPTFYGVAPRGVVPAGLAPADRSSARIDLAGGVDTAGGGGALASHPGDQDSHQQPAGSQSGHPSRLPGNLIVIISTEHNQTCNVITHH